MKRAIFRPLFLALAAAQLPAQLIRPSLPIPQDNPPGQAASAPQVQQDPAKEFADLRKQADGGDGEAAFRVGVTLLIGNGPGGQDAAAAAEYFKKATMTPARMCFLAETYVESAVPGRLSDAEKWALAANSGCGDWELSQLYGTNRLGPDPAKEIEYLKKGLALRNDGFGAQIRARLGQILLAGSAVDATEAERVAWIGEAARQRMGEEEWKIAYSLFNRADQAETSDAAWQWVFRSARYGTPVAMARLGQAAMQREISSLSFGDGIGLYRLGAQQNILAAVGLEFEEKQMDSAEHEELLNEAAVWQRVRDAAGGYYAKSDPLLLPAPIDMDALEKLAVPENPDAELRLAFVYESQGNLKLAGDLYRAVWKNGPAQLWFGLGQEAGKTGKWSRARELYENAANLGSRPACEAIATIDAEGLAGAKDPAGAYLWLALSETTNTKLLAARKAALSSSQLKSVALSQARWLLDHQGLWTGDVKAAQALVAEAGPQFVTSGNTAYININNGTASKPGPSDAELRQKADAGDANAAYQYAIDLLWNRAGIRTDLAVVEKYAEQGAIGPMYKVRLGEAWESTQLFDEATRRKYAEKWFLAAGDSAGYYDLAGFYFGNSDGIVHTDDEKKGVEYWEKAVAAGDERWARLSRMKLGYCVVKGWSSGNKKQDVAWAHELAMEMLGKELAMASGVYSYGRDLPHNPALHLRLAERAAICNIDTAQRDIANEILAGNWKERDDIAAYAWLKLLAVKVDGDKQVELAEQNPELKQKIEARYNLLLQARQESGAYYPQNDPLRTATAADLEPRAQDFDPEAQLRLGQILEQKGSDADLDRALALYHQLWLTAGQEVKLTWGRTLMNGAPGVARDDTGATMFLYDAANSGSHQACRYLAVLYREGRGVKADPVAAEVWLELAGDKAESSSPMTAEERSAVAAKVAEWKQNHQGW
jgi:TPR repeat protein